MNDNPLVLGLLTVLYVLGLLALMLATERAVWKFLVLSWLFLSVFIFAPFIELALRALL